MFGLMCFLLGILIGLLISAPPIMRLLSGRMHGAVESLRMSCLLRRYEVMGAWAGRSDRSGS